VLKVGLDTQVLQSKEFSGYGYYVSGLFDSLKAHQPDNATVIGLKSKLDRDLKTTERFWHDRFELPQLAQQEGVDIIHQPVFSCPKSKKAKVVWTMHDLRQIVLNEAMSLPAALYWKKWLPYSHSYADVLVCTSENSRNDAVKYLGLRQEDIPIIPVGVDSKVIDWSLPKAERSAVLKKFGVTEPFFTTLGTIQPIKNIPFLIDVFVAFRQEFKLTHQLVVIGKKGWDYDNVVKRMKEHGLEEGKDVIITGYVTDDEKWALLSESETFFFPSLYEGFGIPPLEAQALGVPCLVADNSSLPGVVGDGAILCSATDVESWIKGYDKLHKQKQDLITNGKVNVKRFYWDSIGKQWWDLYQSLI
jgi:glycosyltransferase involved in cell wall biosynthesis